MPIPSQMIADGLLTIMVVALMCLMLGLGASTYAIDMHSTQGVAERFRHLSLHDPLTGLPNRAAFSERMAEIFAHRTDDTSRPAFLSFDLDRFKEVNDVHGHAAGDAVLRTISERMSKALVDGEFLARIGGDEFVAMTRNFFMKGDAKAFADRLIAEISRPIEWEGNRFWSERASASRFSRSMRICRTIFWRRRIWPCTAPRPRAPMPYASMKARWTMLRETGAFWQWICARGSSAAKAAAA